MTYIGRSMSQNASIAHQRGLLPVSSITINILRSKGFNYSKMFFKWLCKHGYIRPTEFHHASAAKRLYAYYDLDIITFIVERYNLQELYFLYRRKKTKQDILIDRGVRYLKVAINGQRFGTNRVLYLDCVGIDGYVLWSDKTAINMKNAQIIQNFGSVRPNTWTNSNVKRILRRVLIYKKIYVQSFR